MKHQAKISGIFCFVIFSSFLFQSGTAIVDEWTPEGFDWEQLSRNLPPLGPGEYTGLWMNTSTIPSTTSAESLAALSDGTTDISEQELFPILTALGLAWQLASVVTLGLSLSDAVASCSPTNGTVESPKDCTKGVFLSVTALGAALTPPSFAWDAMKLAYNNVADPISKLVGAEQYFIPHGRRDTTAPDAQIFHDNSVRYQLMSLSHPSSREPEFLGYADADHRLARREFGLHPHVPMFRFEHFSLGPMEVATRATLNGMYISMAPAGHPTHLLGKKRQLEAINLAKRQEIFDEELFSTLITEARFDGNASRADPADIQVDAGSLFNSWLPTMNCLIEGDPNPPGNILSAQMYDVTNEATFGFGSIGVFNSTDDADTIENFLPTGMPLQSLSC